MSPPSRTAEEMREAAAQWHDREAWPDSPQESFHLRSAAAIRALPVAEAPDGAVTAECVHLWYEHPEYSLHYCGHCGKTAQQGYDRFRRVAYSDRGWRCEPMKDTAADDKALETIRKVIGKDAGCRVSACATHPGCPCLHTARAVLAALREAGALR